MVPSLSGLVTSQAQTLPGSVNRQVQSTVILGNLLHALESNFSREPTQIKTGQS